MIQPLKSVIRIATEQDEKTVEKNRQKEKEAFKICQEKIRKHGLDMKLIEAEYTFDNNKVLFYFTADGRIDFRELVKDLAAVLRSLRLCSEQELSFVRLGSEMRRRSAEELVSVDVHYAAARI